jgi:alpha-tubulin suppressor-like RCC1 family protein
VFQVNGHRLISRILAFGLVGAAFSGCSGGGTDTTTPHTTGVASVSLSASESTIRATRSLALKAQAFDAAGNLLPNASFAFASSNNNVATVDISGIVRAIAPGRAVMSVVSEGKIATFSIDVIRAPVAAITVNVPQGGLGFGKSVALIATSIDSSGNVPSDVVYRWRSLDPSVALIDSISGIVTAVSVGTARVEARAEGIAGSGTFPTLPIRFVALSSGYNHTCGLSATGEAFCWGGNGLGELGAGNSPPAIDSCGSAGACFPLAVSGNHIFSRLSEGPTQHTCGISSDGTWCWGRGQNGEIGDGTGTTGNFVPKKVVSSSIYTFVGVGDDLTCGFTTSSLVDCWGSNDGGALGDPAVTGTCAGGVVCSKSPHRVSTSVTFSRISVSNGKACGLTADGIVYCWGRGASTPTPVSTGVRFTDISISGDATCGISTDTRFYCWGFNQYGQLGTGIVKEQPATTAPTDPVASSVPLVKLFNGNAFGCALDAAGVAYCWGKNTEGELGDGTMTNRPGPVPVNTNLRFTTLSPGDFHTCGIATDGYAYCWGYNRYGGLGNGNYVDALTPTRVIGQ